MVTRENGASPVAESAFSRRSLLWLIGVSITSGAGSDGGIAQEDEESNGNETQENETADGGTVTVDLLDYAFEPGTENPLEIPPGTLVRFVWQTDNHNIAIDEQPEESEWEGHEPIENTGFEHEFTFEVEGEHEFHCVPHLGLGMIGTIVVDPEATGNGGDELVPDIVPEPATTLLVATIVALMAVLGLSYVFLKYGGYSGD